MDPNQRRTIARGVYPALLTALRPDGTIDADAQRSLVRGVVAEGVSGICPVGSTGEGIRLGRERRLEVVKEVRAATPQDLPLIAGVPAFNAAQALDELAELSEAGATAGLVSLHRGYALSDDDVLQFYADVADRTPLPVVIYNIPQVTGVSVPANGVLSLAAHPSVVGIKDSSRDMEYLQTVAQGAGPITDFAVLTGTDPLLLAALAIGADGLIGASVNLIARTVVGLVTAWDAGDLSGARKAQRVITAVVGACRRGAAPAGWKGAASLHSPIGTTMAGPARPITDADLSGLALELERALASADAPR